MLTSVKGIFDQEIGPAGRKQMFKEHV
jgi:hypothetical protein